jgi:hypothetical protein
MTGIMCKPPRHAAHFSKANWGDHIKYDADKFEISVYPTSTLIDLIDQLKPRQWEKILVAATEDSKSNLSSDAFPFASMSSANPGSQTRPKPQLRDDDSDIDMD